MCDSARAREPHCRCLTLQHSALWKLGLEWVSHHCRCRPICPSLPATFHTLVVTVRLLPLYATAACVCVHTRVLGLSHMQVPGLFQFDAEAAIARVGSNAFKSSVQPRRAPSDTPVRSVALLCESGYRCAIACSPSLYVLRVCVHGQSLGRFDSAGHSSGEDDSDLPVFSDVEAKLEVRVWVTASCVLSLAHPCAPLSCQATQPGSSLVLWWS